MTTLFCNANTLEVYLLSLAMASIPNVSPGMMVCDFLNVHNSYSNLKYLAEFLVASLKNISSS